jgi:VWFA-related protein
MNPKVLCLALAVIIVSAAHSQQPQTPAPSAPASAATAPVPAAKQAPATQSAQQGSAASSGDQNPPVIPVVVNEVPLIFTVTDGRGHYIPNLQQSDFALLDNQRAPAKVNRFLQQINLPLRVGLLIDTSTSIHSRFQFEQQSATEFLLEVLKAKGDRAFVMGFDVTPDVTQDWTNNLDALETGVNKLKSGGGTALFDAVYTACRDKLLTSRGPEPVRKALIVISDGDDNQSRVYENEAIKECQRADTIIYSISTNWTPSRGSGDKVMQDLAEETGGEPFFPPNVEDMATSFTNIETELRSQYELDYTPADFKTDGSFRTIYLYCYNRGYHVHARKGYFSPKE